MENYQLFGISVIMHDKIKHKLSHLGFLKAHILFFASATVFLIMHVLTPLLHLFQ